MKPWVMRPRNEVPGWPGRHGVLMGSLETILRMFRASVKERQAFSTSARLYPETLRWGIRGHQCNTGVRPGLEKLAGDGQREQ